MSDDKPHALLFSRRDYLLASGAALAGLIFAPSRALARPQHPATLRELDATSAQGIDLYIKRERVMVGAKPGKAITINGSFPGPVIRMQEGKQALIRVHNQMKEATSVHWHGILLPFTMDGVPGISFEGIAAGETFTYRYEVTQSGTYWYHSHSGFQEQLGQYGQIIIDPRTPDTVSHDVEHSLVLSDWTFEQPEDIFQKLKKIEGYFNFQRPTLANFGAQVRRSEMSAGEVLRMRARWNRMRMDPTDIADVTGATYAYLINGRTAQENPTFLASMGQRVRLRLVNASAMTYFDVRIPGVPMLVVQADGQDVEPVEVDELRIAVAETYDVIVTLPDDAARTIFAETMDRSGFARATLAPRQGMASSIPARRARPMLGMADMGMMHDMKGMDHKQMKPADMKGGMEGMDHGAMSHEGSKHEGIPLTNLPERREHGPGEHGPASITMAESAYRRFMEPGIGLGDDGWRVLTYAKLRARGPLPGRRAPTREIDMHLTGNMQKYIWGFDGKKWSESDMLQLVYGERVRINFFNDTMMTHPIHLHGMWMDLYAGHSYDKNPRKHTVSVQPAELLSVDITVDAPGQWAFHCHLLYHMEAGMFRTVAVVKSLSEEAVHAEH